MRPPLKTSVLPLCSIFDISLSSISHFSHRVGLKAPSRSDGANLVSLESAIDLVLLATSNTMVVNVWPMTTTNFREMEGGELLYRASAMLICPLGLVEPAALIR